MLGSELHPPTTDEAFQPALPGIDEQIAVGGLNILFDRVGKLTREVAVAQAHQTEFNNYLGATILHNWDREGVEAPEPITPQTEAQRRQALDVHKALAKVGAKKERERWIGAVSGDAGHYSALATRKAKRNAKKEIKNEYRDGTISSQEAHDRLTNVQYIVVRKPHQQEKAHKGTERAAKRAMRLAYQDPAEIEKERPKLNRPTYVQPEFTFPSRDRDEEGLWESVKRVVAESQSATPALLLRHLPIHPDRARELIQALEDAGYVSEQPQGKINGPDPRRVFLPKPAHKPREGGRTSRHEDDEGHRHEDSTEDRDAKIYTKAMQRYTENIELITKYEKNPAYKDMFEVDVLKDLHERIQKEVWPLYEKRLAELNKDKPEDEKIARVEDMPASERKILVDPIDRSYTQEYISSSGKVASDELYTALTLARLKAVGKLRKPTKPAARK